MRVDARLQALAPGLDARIGDEVPLVLRQLRPAGAAGVEPARIARLAVVDPLGQEALLVLAARFVAVGHEHEGRMVAVGFEDAVGLVVHPVRRPACRRRASWTGWPTTTHSTWQIEAEFVGRDEGRLGRAPRVEADVVQPVRLADADDALPRRQRPSADGRSCGKMQHSSVPRRNDRAAVDRELRARRRESRGGRSGSDA